jgi:hypothetical protein
MGSTGRDDEPRAQWGAGREGEDLMALSLAYFHSRATSQVTQDHNWAPCP